MTSLCKLKTCHKGLDINPSQLNVENIGSIVIPLGGDPTAYVEVIYTNVSLNLLCIISTFIYHTSIFYIYILFNILLSNIVLYLL